jgi:hypothetical protein
MKSRTFFFLLFLAANHCLSQIIPNPHLSFEKLNWCDSLKSVQRLLVGKNLREMPKDDNPFAKSLENSKPFMYTDTLFGKLVGVTLLFSKSTERLESIQCAFFGFDAATKKQPENIESLLNEFWAALETRYGKPSSDRSIPFMGKKREWEFPSTDATALLITGMAKAASISYSKK